MPDEEYNRRYAKHCTEANDWMYGVTSAGVNVFNWRNLEENTILGPFAYCGNHLDEYLNPNATYEDLVGYSENVFNSAAMIAGGYKGLKGKTGRLTRAENVADGVVKAEEIVGQGKILEKVDDISKTISQADRIKIDGWDYTPNDELYLKYKDVFDNAKYYNQETGQRTMGSQEHL